MKKKNTSKLLIFTLFLFCTPTEDLEVVELNEKINNCINTTTFENMKNMEEKGFFEESLVCISNKEMNILNKEDLLKEFQKTVVSCKDVEFTLFGLSLATINGIISFILSVINFKLFLNYEKNK